MKIFSSVSIFRLFFFTFKYFSLHIRFIFESKTFLLLCETNTFFSLFRFNFFRFRFASFLFKQKFGDTLYQNRSGSATRVLCRILYTLQVHTVYSYILSSFNLILFVLGEIPKTNRRRLLNMC
jgi:hypothetical protein